MKPIFVTMKEGERISGLSRSSLYREMDALRLKSRKVRGRRLIEVESLQALGSEEA
jgi:hypothetical protein